MVPLSPSAACWAPAQASYEVVVVVVVVVAVVVVVVHKLTRIIKSVVTGQAPVTLQLRNTR